MKEIWTVFQFTLKDAVRKKVFLITTAIVLVLIVGVCALPGIIQAAGGDNGADDQPQDQEKTFTCYWVDDQQLVPGAVEALKQAFGTIEFVPGTSAGLEEQIESIKDKDDSAAIEVLPGEGLPTLKVYAKNFTSGVPADAIAAVVKNVYVSSALSQAGVPDAMTAIALSDIAYEMETVGKMDLSGYILGIVLVMIIFFAVYYYGYGVAMSVASEKTSRVMETLVVSAKPSRILLGKCLAMGVLGLLQLTAFLLVGVASFSLLVPDGFLVGGMPLTLSSFTVQSALLILLYFLLGYALYAMLNSVCGATVSRTEDLNAAMMPTVLVSLISFYAAYIVMFMPNDTVKRIVTYVPFTSPFIMPFRLLNETVPAVDILVSILLLAVFIVVIAAVSIRLYSASVLHYGQRIKLRSLRKFRM